MQSTGLLEVWRESNLMGQKTAENVMAGKDFSKVLRAHKITSQALWQIILPQLSNFIQNKDIAMKNSLKNAEDYDDLIRVLSEDKFCNILSHFVSSHHSDTNFIFWWDYIQMVKVLLMFIRSQRDGIWDLHLLAFRSMLPYLYRYDHTYYARWGAIYLADINQ